MTTVTATAAATSAAATSADDGNDDCGACHNISDCVAIGSLIAYIINMNEYICTWYI